MSDLAQGQRGRGFGAVRVQEARSGVLTSAKEQSSNVAMIHNVIKENDPGVEILTYSSSYLLKHNDGYFNILIYLVGKQKF